MHRIMQSFRPLRSVRIRVCTQRFAAIFAGSLGWIDFTFRWRDLEVISPDFGTLAVVKIPTRFRLSVLLLSLALFLLLQRRRMPFIEAPLRLRRHQRHHLHRRRRVHFCSSSEKCIPLQRCYALLATRPDNGMAVYMCAPSANKHIVPRCCVPM